LKGIFPTSKIPNSLEYTWVMKNFLTIPFAARNPLPIVEEILIEKV